MEMDCNLKKLGQLFQVLSSSLRKMAKSYKWLALPSRIHLISSSWSSTSILCKSKGNSAFFPLIFAAQFWQNISKTPVTQPLTVLLFYHAVQGSCSFCLSLWMVSLNVTNQAKALWQYLSSRDCMTTYFRFLSNQGLFLTRMNN